jgi:hypothetical protein
MLEHFALFVQQLATRSSCNALYVAELKILPLPQVTERHLVASVSQHVFSSEVAHEFVAQYKVPVLCFLPEGQVNVVHDARPVQQAPTVVPATLYLAESLYLSTPHATEAPLHLVASFSQHMLLFSVVQPAPVQVEVQAVPVQYVVAAAAMCFMPASQVTESHFALIVQHVASVVPVAPFLAASLILFVPQVTEAPLHLVASSTQQVASSVFAHVPVAQYVVA